MFPFDWYWIVAGDETQAYSSARGIYVLINDSAYTAWLDTFARASHIETEEEMLSILAMFGL